jgi:hypothetical protein
MSLQLLIPHLQLNIFMTPTFHRTPISDENLEVVNHVNETMERHSLGFINEVMGSALSMSTTI